MKLLYMGNHKKGDFWIKGFINCVWSDDVRRTALIFCIPFPATKYSVELEKRQFGIWGFCFGLFRDERRSIPYANFEFFSFCKTPIEIWDFMVADYYYRRMQNEMVDILRRD